MTSVCHLFDLLVDIKMLAYEHKVFLKLLHISGNRIIATGIDGGSQGDQDAGTALGVEIRDFIPLHWSEFDYPDNMLPIFFVGAGWSVILSSLWHPRIGL